MNRGRDRPPATVKLAPDKPGSAGRTIRSVSGRVKAAGRPWLDSAGGPHRPRPPRPPRDRMGGGGVRRRSTRHAGDHPGHARAAARRRDRGQGLHLRAARRRPGARRDGGAPGHQRRPGAPRSHVRRSGGPGRLGGGRHRVRVGGARRGAAGVRAAGPGRPPDPRPLRRAGRRHLDGAGGCRHGRRRVVRRVSHSRPLEPGNGRPGPLRRARRSPTRVGVAGSLGGTRMRAPSRLAPPPLREETRTA
jgi:hypothetical protein